MNRILCSLMLLVFSTLTMVAQTRTITGRVLDGDFNNEPLIGAAIRMEFSDKNHPEHPGTYTPNPGECRFWGQHRFRESRGAP